jgi:integrase
MPLSRSKAMSRTVDKASRRPRPRGRLSDDAHVLRHTAAMELLQARVDHALIAIWLGHESVETSQPRLERRDPQARPARSNHARVATVLGIVCSTSSKDRNRSTV